MKGTLYIQLDKKGKRIKKPKPVECEIDLGKDTSAIAGTETTIVAKLKRARVEFISANGLMISGIHEVGCDPFPILRYQEWWFIPILEG